MIRYVLFIILALVSFQSQAEIYGLKNTKIELDIPSEWQKSLNFMQNPLTLFGPVSGQKENAKVQRAAWIFSDAPKGEERLNKAQLEEKQDDYFAGRYERAVQVWSRVFFLDRSNARARAYIERARGALAERQRVAEAARRCGAREVLVAGPTDGEVVAQLVAYFGAR